MPKVKVGVKKGGNMSKKKTGRDAKPSRIEMLVRMATMLHPVSARSGAMMDSGVSTFITPQAHGVPYFGKGSAAGGIRHAAQVRATKKGQRRRDYFQRMKG